MADNRKNFPDCDPINCNMDDEERNENIKFCINERGEKYPIFSNFPPSYDMTGLAVSTLTEGLKDIASSKRDLQEGFDGNAILPPSCDPVDINGNG